MGLTGEACRNHVRKSSVLESGTGLHELTHVAKDRGGWQVSVSDSSGDDLLAVVVDLDIPDWSPAEQEGSKQPAAGPAEERELTHTPP